MSISQTYFSTLALTAVFLCHCQTTADRAELEVARERVVVCNGVTITVVSLPGGTTLGDVTLGANGNIFVSDRADVFGVLANAGQGQVNVGVDATTGSVASIAPVTLRDRAIVSGSVTSASSIALQNGVVVTGAVQPFTPLSASNAASIRVTFPDAPSGGIQLSPNATGSLAPGDYASVSLGASAVLTLSPGTYSLNSLVLEPNSEIRLPAGNQPVLIAVKSSLIYRGEIKAVDGSDLNLLLLYIGTAPATLERRFNGFYVGMDSSLTLTGNGVTYRGAFFARDITVTPDLIVQHRAFDPSAFSP